MNFFMRGSGVRVVGFAFTSDDEGVDVVPGTAMARETGREEDGEVAGYVQDGPAFDGEGLELAGGEECVDYVADTVRAARGERKMAISSSVLRWPGRGRG